jgi:polysaccharide pyruvyl transferase WcaK-like protein
MKLNCSFFSPKTQFENIGDALINREMIKLAAEESQVYVDFSRCPDDFVLSLGLGSQVKSVHFGILGVFFLMVMKRLLGKDCFYFLSPGGYFGDINMAEIPKRYLNFFLIVIFKAIGIKLCHVGVSYERLGPKFCNLIRRRSKFLYYHAVRDEISLEYARENGIKVHEVIPDLAYNIFDEKEKKLGKVKNRAFCFSFRVDQNDLQIELARDIIITLDKIVDINVEFKFYSQVERDSVGMSNLCNSIRKITERKCDFVSIIGDIEKSNVFFRHVDTVISNRLHVLLMSSSKMCNIIPIYYQSYNEKVIGIMSSYRTDGSVVFNMDSFDSVVANEALEQELNIYKLGLDEKDKLKNAFLKIFREKK